MNLPAYRKTLTALVTGVIGWAGAVTVSAPARITAAEWIVLATVLATALGVFGMPNEDNKPRGMLPDEVQALLDESYRRGKSKKAKLSVESGQVSIPMLIALVLLVLILFVVTGHLHF